MKRKRLDRDLGWGFQGFPYYQFRLELPEFCGLAGLIDIISGVPQYWHTERAGNVMTAGAGMKWLQLVPDGQSRMLTAMFLPDGRLSVCYIDIIERLEYDPDGVAAYVDKYLDVVFTPQGDLGVFDRDELDAALESRDITRPQYDSALEECELILSELCRDIPTTSRMLCKILKTALERIESGEKPLYTKYQKEITERGN